MYGSKESGDDDDDNDDDDEVDNAEGGCMISSTSLGSWA